ncbi:PREDICTED: zinc finger protein 407 [Nanorana parkeri]|uniref:zinc finger protein 407 n=1 Tax=Nanorana parkeri TaxID=125878 RepID=UPI00085423AF|nr:PREDICTED: zinc finger protein 407 [Nanorana parkeri]
MENDQRKQAEETQEEDKSCNAEQIFSSQCETSDSVCYKRPVSENFASSKMEVGNVENPHLAKRIRLETLESAPEKYSLPTSQTEISKVIESEILSAKLFPLASPGTMSTKTQEGCNQNLPNVLQNITDNTIDNSSSSYDVVDELLSTKSHANANNMPGEMKANTHVGLHVETQSNILAKAPLKAKEMTAEKGKPDKNIDSMHTLDPSPTYVQNKIVLKEDGKTILSCTDTVSDLEKEGAPLTKENKEVSRSASRSGFGKISSKRNAGEATIKNGKPSKSSLEMSETKNDPNLIFNAIGKIIARRRHDRKEHQRKGLYRRKHGFKQLKKHLQLLKKRGTLKDHIAFIKDNKLPPSNILPAEPTPETPPHTEHVSDSGIIKDAQSVINIPSSAFEIVRNTPPIIQYGCIYCESVVASKEDMFVHFWKRHARQMKFYCQTCGYSCVTRGDFEKHCHNDIHDETNVSLNCYLCGLDASDESTFRIHMTAKHKMPFHCNSCKVFFKSNDDRLHHETAEEHIWDNEKMCNPSGADNLELKSDANTSLPAVQISTVVNTVEISVQEVVVNEVKRRQFQCKQCFYKTRSSTVLTRHIKLRHAHEFHFLCKACNIYTMHKEGMERHIKRSKHIENARKNNIGLLFEECIEKVSYEGFTEIASTHKDRSQSEDFNTTSTEDSYCSKHAASQAEHTDSNTPKKGRPKGNISISCTHCGLMASSVTNLKVHIRRKHTHQYNFKCKLCNYDTVTKGDMERHCLTKKHISRVEDQPAGQRKNEIVVTIEGQKFESVKKKGSIGNVASKNVGTTSVCLPGSQKEHSVNVDSTINIQSENSLKDYVDNGIAEDSQVQGMCTDNSGNQCSHCEFVGDSASLELHVKGSHIKEFEYYCKACNYYAVSHQQMSSHVLTEKHMVNHESAQSSASLLDKMACNLHNSPENLSCGKIREESIQPAPLLEPNKVNVVEKSLDAKIAVEHELVETDQHVISDSEKNRVVVLRKQESGDENLLVDTLVQEYTVNAVSDHIENEHTGAESLPEDAELCTAQISENGGTSEHVSTYRKTNSGILFDSSIVKLKMDCKKQSDNHASSVPEPKPQSTKKKKFNGSTQGDSTRIRCDECGFLADGLSGLNVHISMKHPVKEKHFHCLLCGKSFFTESNLHQHLASIGHQKNEQASFEELPEGGGTFKCVKCTEPFDSEQSLFIHIKEEHEELLREVNKYIEEDTEQINREREENQGNICKYCGKTCKSSNSMAFLAHIRTHTGSKPFKCKICHFAAAQLGDARNHVKRHLGMREYKCHVCGVAFVMRKHLNNHLLGKHGVGTPKERKFACNLCYRSFREKWSLNNHMKLHTGEKPFKCTWPTCHYSFLTASAMKDHYRTHTGEKSFLCDLCGFAGGTRHALTKHRRQHTGEKPFKCDECNFASATQSHLTRHKRVHTGEKPYMCPWCDYRSNCAENVRKHILHTGKHEGVKMYNCPKCSYGTNSPMEFRNHLKEQHTDIENPDLAYLHAGIVSKSFECRLKGLGANFVETTSPFTASSPSEPSPAKENIRSSKKQSHPTEQVQQVIIIQGFSEEYDGNITINSSVEETAAATLQTLAMASQVARVVHITEDGQVIATDQATHMGSIIPGNILSEQLSERATQVVVVEAPMEETEIEESVAIETVTDSSGNVVQQVMTQGILDVSQTVHASDSSSALDALLCAVTELGNGEGSRQQSTENSTIEESLVRMTREQCAETSEGEIQMFEEVHESEHELEPIGVVRQIMHSSGFVTSQDSAFKNMVQGVLQFAMCNSAAADQLIKEGVTQVILNNEGTVHMVSAEGPRIIMHNTDGHTISLPEQQMSLVEGEDGEISQIIVTEELARAMVQNVNGNFEEATTHYIVTEIPQAEKESNIYSHTVIETEDSTGILHEETVVDSQVPVEDSSQEINMVVYAECSSEDSISKPHMDQ